MRLSFVLYFSSTNRFFYNICDKYVFKNEGFSPGPFSQQIISILNQIKSHGFRGILKHSTSSMAFHGIHGCMNINKKHWVDCMEMEADCSMDSTEIFHSISTVFWKSMEMQSEYSMEVAVESTEFHGNLRDGSGSANACIIRCILSLNPYWSL